MCACACVCMCVCVCVCVCVYVCVWPRVYNKEGGRVSYSSIVQCNSCLLKVATFIIIFMSVQCTPINDMQCVCVHVSVLYMCVCVSVCVCMCVIPPITRDYTMITTQVKSYIHLLHTFIFSVLL